MLDFESITSWLSVVAAGFATGFFIGFYFERYRDHIDEALT